MPKSSINGIELYYERHGSGPAVIFAHGVGGNHLIWWQQVPEFSSSYECITFDHRAFGQSNDIPDGPGAAAFVDDLRALLDDLQIQKAFLVAQSMGGLACLGFALAYPERCYGLVLGSTGAGIGDPSVLEPLRKHISPTDTRDRFAAPSFIQNEAAKTFLYLDMSALNPPRSPDFLALMRSDDGPQAADLANLQVPTLLIAGSEDRVIPNAVMKRCHELIPGSQYEVIQDAGHSVFFEKPHEFNQLLRNFFENALKNESQD